MYALVLAASLLSQDAVVPEPVPLEEVCKKWDGAKPTRCEQALAYNLYGAISVIEMAAAELEAEKAKNAMLIQQLNAMPAPEEKSSWALFGLPGWVTPVLAGVLVGAGVGVGLAF